MGPLQPRGGDGPSTCSWGWARRRGQAPQGEGSTISLSRSAGACLGRAPKPVHHGRTWEVETPPPVPPKLSWTNLPPRCSQPEGAERGWGRVSPSPWTPAPSRPRSSILSELLPHWPRGTHLPVPFQARGRWRPQARLEAAGEPTGSVGAGWIIDAVSLAALSPGHCCLRPSLQLGPEGAKVGWFDRPSKRPQFKLPDRLGKWVPFEAAFGDTLLTPPGLVHPVS